MSALPERLRRSFEQVGLTDDSELAPSVRVRDVPWEAVEIVFAQAVELHMKCPRLSVWDWMDLLVESLMRPHIRLEDMPPLVTTDEVG